METSKEIILSVNSLKSYLSSETRIFKTERFFFATKKIANIDKFILEIAEEIQTIAGDLLNFKSTKKSDDVIDCFKVETVDRQFAFLFTLGGKVKNTLSELENKDIVFLDDVSGYENLRSNDQRVNLFLNNSKIFSVVIKETATAFDASAIKKLYHVTSSNFVSLPLLNENQNSLVKVENQNVLVQGVAGSGKTNICISKIVFAASRNYSGKVLYTTFSRGLLIDTKNKVELFKNNIKNFIETYENNRIVFLDKNHKKAIENRLGIELEYDGETKFLEKLKQVVNFLETHVDYFLIEDIFTKTFGENFEIANEKTFTENFLKNLGNHQLKSKLEKLKNVSVQIIYKEIYGMIFGALTESELAQKKDSVPFGGDYSVFSNPDAMLSLQDYTKRRENSFDKHECEIIYNLARDYAKFKSSQKFIDNNDISRKLLANAKNLPKYSLSILDEVQDFTQINLKLFESISLKMLCVGDALQMINPSYFNFSFLKNLMYREDLTQVAELEHNYRNNKKIAELLDRLGEINIKEFGTHSFVLGTKSVDQTAISNVVFTNDNKFISRLKNEKFENFTILVSNDSEKQALRQVFKRQEVLTISEIKGLERDTVLLYNILSDNFEKWQSMSRAVISHKQSDENSVYRYYFNLLYVGLSRAKHNIFVFEDKDTHIFSDFFMQNFNCTNGDEAYDMLSDAVSKIEIDDDEIMSRVDEFIKLGQFDNARFYAEKFDDAIVGGQALAKIDAFEQFVFKGKNKEAGIKLWKAGLVNEAKQQFEISGDKALIDFLNNLESRNMQSLDTGVVKFFTDFEDNKDAQKLIVDVIKQDLENIKQKHKENLNKLKNFKEKQNGK